VSFEKGFWMTLGVGIKDDATLGKVAADLAQNACFQKRGAVIHSLKPPDRITANPVSGLAAATVRRRPCALRRRAKPAPWDGALRWFRGPSATTRTAQFRGAPRRKPG
jgi:hypothetical protein